MKNAHCHECGIRVQIFRLSDVPRVRCSQPELCRRCVHLRGSVVEISLGAPLCEALEDLLLADED